MLLNFDEMIETANPGFKGGEGTFYTKIQDDGINKILMGRLPQNASIGMHTHIPDSEIMYFLEGEGTIIFDGDKLPVRAGQSHYCPKGHDHTLINTGSQDLKFFAVITRQ